jgi:hypothetical protein
VSKFSSSHPGGRVILSSLGAADSTDVFSAFHLGTTFSSLERFYIGDIDKQKDAPTRTFAEPSAFELEYRALGSKMKALGLFKAKCVPAAAPRARARALASASRQGAARVVIANPPPPSPSSATSTTCGSSSRRRPSSSRRPS